LPLLGIVALAGITDLRRTGTACDMEVGKLMNGSAQAQASLYDLASPLALLPLKVPQVIVQGDSDRIIPPVMATTYIDAAKQKGDVAKLVLIEKAGHFELVDPQAAAWVKVKEEILSLLNSNTKK
jgi:pimeloyl-ACP methyl ester carboxylesterase